MSCPDDENRKVNENLSFEGGANDLDSESSESFQSADDVSESSQTNRAECERRPPTHGDHNSDYRPSIEPVPQKTINMYKEMDEDKMNHLKIRMQENSPKLMSELLKVLIYLEEEKLACFMMIHYDILMEPEIIEACLGYEYYHLLHTIWALGKNYYLVPDITGELQKEYISYQELFSLHKEEFNDPEMFNTLLVKAVNWLVVTDDNILIALLQYEKDDLALEYMGYYYQEDINTELLLYCLKNGNEIFLKSALKKSAFEKRLFREPEVINEFINLLKGGTRTNYLLNILTLIDLSTWKDHYLKELIEVLNEYESNPLDENRLLLSYNPIMSICLAAEILTNIGKSRRKLENECKRIKNTLLFLGRMYSLKIEDESFYEQLISDRDFKGRTVLKIICEEKLEPLMDENDPKAENMMLKIWHGKEATKCDGILNGYSSLTHMLKSSTKKLTGSFLSIISNHYKPNFDVDYSFQYKYRSKAVSFFFKKEFF